MKKIIFFISTIVCGTIATAQNWAPVGIGINGVNNTVNALDTLNGNLIVAGNFTTAGGYFSNYIAQWDGSTWATPVGTGTDGYINCLCTYGGELYAGGIFNSAGGNTAWRIAKWNGTNWSAVGTGLTQNGCCMGGVSAMVVYNGNLYVAGNFLTAGGVTVNNIAKWNGISWAALGSGITVLGGQGVQSLCVHNNKLIVGGAFGSAGGNTVNNIASWDGVTWSTLGTGISAKVNGLCSYNNNLYEGNSTLGITMWNGSTWSPVGTGLNNQGAYSFTQYGSNLFVGGGFSTAGGISAWGVAQWDGTNWYSAGTGTNPGIGGGAFALIVYKTEVYAGGFFSGTADATVNFNNIARWNAVNNIHEQGVMNTFSVYPNPTSDLITVTRSNNNVVESYTLTDQLGRIVLSGKLLSSTTTIDIESISKGIYALEITGTTKHSYKVIKD